MFATCVVVARRTVIGHAQGATDDRLDLAMYERSEAQNDELGVTGMNTEHYHEGR